jgi:hypothetical protein
MFPHGYIGDTKVIVVGHHNLKDKALIKRCQTTQKPIRRVGS